MSADEHKGEMTPSLAAVIVASIPLGLYVLDAQGRFLYLNALAERFFQEVSGRGREQLLGELFWEKCPEVADSTFVKEYQRAVTEQRTFELEVFYPVLKRWFIIRAAPGGAASCFFFWDITDSLKLSAEHHRRLGQRHDPTFR